MSYRSADGGGGAAGGAQSATSPGALVKNLRNGLFGSMFIMSKRVVTPAWRTKVELVVRIAQMLAFVVSPRVGAPWPGMMAPIVFISGIFNISVLSLYYRAQLLVLLFYTSLTFVLLVAVLLGYGMFSFMNGSISALWPLKLLRTCGSLAAGVLFVPLLQQLLSAFECIGSSSPWAPGYDCGSPVVGVLQAAAVVLALMLIGLALLFSAVFYESDSLSTSLDARAHGRADLIMLLLQALLVMTTNTFAANLQLWIIIVVLALSGVVWLVSFIVWMPYYVHWLNTANIAGATAFLWTVACAIINNYVSDANAAVMLYMGIPVAALAGVALSDIRASMVLRTPPSRLTSAYDVELRTRYMLHAALWGHPTVRSQEALRESAERLHSTAGTGHGATAPPAAALDDMDASDDAEDRAAALRKLIASEIIAEVQAMYRTAAARMRGSSILHVFCARFYSTWQGNRHMQFSHLLQAERRSPPLDVAYLVFAARKVAEDGTSGGQQLSAMNRVAFEKYSADARRYVQHAAQRQLSFWAELQDTTPDLTRLHRVSKETNDAIAAAERSFEELFLINPQSIGMLRLYAAFNLHVTCNAEKAGVLLSEADRLEDQKSKDHRNGEGNARLSLFAESNLDVWAENTSIVTISAASRDLGTILSLNAAACKLFGFARLQLERRPVFSLFSSPFDQYHDAALRSYVATGESNIVGYTRVLFAMHKSGHMLPILSSLRDAPADGGPPSFIWLVRELRPPHQHVLMDDEFRLLGVTSGSQSLLGVTSASMAAREVRIGDFIGEWDAPGVRAELQTSAGTTLRVDTRVVVAEEDAEQGGDDNQDADSTRADNDDEVTGTSRLLPRSRALTRRTSLSYAWDNNNAASGAVGDLQSTWVRAQLQRTEAPGMPACWLLHWQRVPETELHILAKAAARRATLMGSRESAPPQQPAAAATAHVDAGRHLAPASTRKQPQPTVVTARSVLPAQLPMSRRSSRPASPHPILMDPPEDASLGAAGALAVMQHPSAVMTEDSTPLSDNRTSTDGDANDEVMMSMMGGSQQISSEEANPVTVVTVSMTAADVRSTAGLLRHTSGVPVSPHAAASTGIIRSSSYRPSQPEDSDGGSVAASVSKGAARKTIAPNGGRSVASGTVRDRGDRGSHCSGTSSRKSATAQRAVTRLRRSLAARNQPLLKGLWWLRSVGLLLTVVAIALAATVSVITRASFQQYYDNVSYVGMGAKRMVYKSSAIYGMQDLMMHGHGWVTLDAAGIAQRRAEILGNASAFMDVHTSMFDMVQGSAAAASYSTRYVTMTQFDAPPNGVAGPYITMNLMEVGASFVTTSQQIANANISTFADVNNPDVTSINYNFMRNGNGHEVLQRSMISGYVISLNTRDDVQRIQTVVFVSMVAVIMFFGGAVFLPILHTVEKTADTVMLQFVTLPVAVRRALHAQALQRVRVLRRNFLADDDDLDTDSDADDDEGTGFDAEAAAGLGSAADGEGKRRQGGRVGGGDAGDGTIMMTDADTSPDIDWDELLGQAGAVNARNGRSPASPPARSISNDRAAGSANLNAWRGSAGSTVMPSAAAPALKSALKQSTPAADTVTSIDETSALGIVVHHDSDSEPPAAPHWYAATRSRRGAGQVRSGSSTGVKKTGRTFLFLVGRFSLPLIGLLILFTAIFGNFVSTLNRSVALTSIAAAANTRASCSRQAMMDLRKLSFVTTNPQYNLNSYWFTMDAVDCVRWHVRLLGYGTTSKEFSFPYTRYVSAVENGQQSVLSASTTARVHGVMFGDACTFLAYTSPAFNITRCRAFGGGVLTQGLAAATEQWYNIAYQVGDRQLRNVFTIGSLFQGLGWLMCADSFDYTSSQCIRAAGCILDRDTTMPTDGSALPPTPLPDFSFVGDVQPGPAPVNACEPYAVVNEVTSVNMQWLLEADSLYLTPAFLAIGALYETEAKDNISSFISFLAVFVPIYMVTFAGVMLHFLWQVSTTNNDIQTKRGMLLYLPLQVVARVKSIRALVDEILDAGSGGTGSASSAPEKRAGHV